MFRTLKRLSTQKPFYAFILFSALSLEGAALFFQYGLGLSPCVMCVYERLALFGILFASFLGLLHPKNLICRLLTLIMMWLSSLKGVLIALKHVDYQLNPSPWNQCAFLPDFPKSLPLNEWFPFLFQPTGSCNDIVWSFLGFSMAQWILVMFAGFLLIFSLMLLSQFARLHRNRYLFTENP